MSKTCDTCEHLWETPQSSLNDPHPPYHCDLTHLATDLDDTCGEHLPKEKDNG